MDNDTLQAALAAWAAGEGEHNDAGVSATPSCSNRGNRPIATMHNPPIHTNRPIRTT